MSDAYADLAVDPSDEELARDWSLSVTDLEEVRRCRGDDNRHRFAVQLCALRVLGHFVDDVTAVPVRIANHVGRQIGRPPVLFIEPTDRRATKHEHAERLRVYLGYQPFDEERLKGWLDERADDGAAGAALLDGAIRTLRTWKVEAPARSTLERLVRSASARGEEAAWERLYERMSPEFCASIDGLLAVSDRKSTLFQLKQYPPDAKPGAIRAYLKRVALLGTIGASALDFSGVDPETVARLASFTRRYDVDDLRRFAPAKRYALVACFLVEAQKTILDHVVEMHRVYMTGMARRARGAVDDRHREVRNRATKGLATLLQAIDVILDGALPPAARVDELYQQVDEESLRAAVATCRELHDLGDRGYVDELLARHSHMKQYLPGFLELPFRGEPGAEGLLAAVDVARRLQPGDLPDDAPVSFATGLWRTEVDGWARRGASTGAARSPGVGTRARVRTSRRPALRRRVPGGESAPRLVLEPGPRRRALGTGARCRVRRSRAAARAGCGARSNPRPARRSRQPTRRRPRRESVRGPGRRAPRVQP